MKVTQWFLSTTPPKRYGVYQRLWADEITYSYWTGSAWMFSGRTPDEAISSIAVSNTQIARWRGIAR